MWDRLGKIATIATIIGFILGLSLFFEQSTTFPKVAAMLSSIPVSLLERVITLLLFSVLWICLWRQDALKKQLEEHINTPTPSPLNSEAFTIKKPLPLTSSPVPVSPSPPQSLFPSWTPPTGKFYTGLRECIRRGHDLLKFYQSPERESDQQHREWRIGVDDYIASHARDAGKGSFAIRWRRHISPNDYPTLPIEIHGRNRKLYTDIFSRMELLEEFIRELDS